jgi:putative protease
MDRIEIMAPAGAFDSLSAALRAGADSIYFGVGKLNMRARATANFTVRDLPGILRRCRAAGARAYLTVNTIIYDEELAEMRQLCDAAKAAGVDAVIASDLAVIRYAHSIGLEVHLSVQANICNLEAVRFYAAYADVMVLARELTLPQIKSIADAVRREPITGPAGEPVRLEVFAHGALCVAVSGKCEMSLAVYNSSANRGACFQNCRRSYRVTDAESGDELLIDNQYVMSPKDLCTIGVLDRILESGISVLKLEGRGRSADYVDAVTSCYREAVEACRDGSFGPEKIDGWLERLLDVFNRGFWHGGYYLGEKLGEWTGSGNSQARLRKIHVGRVSHYFPQLKVAELSVEAVNLEKGREIMVTGPTTGAIRFFADELRVGGQSVQVAEKPVLASVPVPVKVRPNDQVYLLETRKFGEVSP